MNAQFQSLFENVCRCFGHTPTSRGTGGDQFENAAGDTYGYGDNVINAVNSETSSISGKRRTNRLKLNDKQYDELFDKVKRGSKASQTSSQSTNVQPPRYAGQKKMSDHGDNMTTISDHDTAHALAQAKLAANPPRYRTKRKRPTQTREDIFRNKNGNSRLGSASCMNGGGATSGAVASASQSTNKSTAPKTDFSRLLNPSLALCFATPIRGTEEEQEELELKSLDHSDTATLNTNGDDTITSTLYFDSKYAHIQESTPPMPLFSQFKIGQAKDEIRTIMATDSHSSVRMIKIMEQNQHHEDHLRLSGREQEQNQKRISTTTALFEEAEGESNIHDETGHSQQIGSRIRGHLEAEQSTVSNTKGKPRIMETIKITSDGQHGSDETEYAVPDVKPLSSSTDSSRLSNNAARHASIQ